MSPREFLKTTLYPFSLSSFSMLINNSKPNAAETLLSTRPTKLRDSWLLSVSLYLLETKVPLPGKRLT